MEYFGFAYYKKVIASTINFEKGESKHSFKLSWKIKISVFVCFCLSYIIIEPRALMAQRWRCGLVNNYLKNKSSQAV